MIHLQIFTLKKGLVKCTYSNKNRLRYLYLLAIIFISTQLKSQVELDASAVDSTLEEERYIDYSDQLLLKVMSVVKANNLEITNTGSNQSLKLAPYGITSLGFGFNYKWLGLGIAFGLPPSAADKAKYGNTSRFDFQLNIYSKKFVVDAFAQQYKGFYIENPNQLTVWNESFFPQRDSMQTFSLGSSGYYVFNNKNLSYKAAYVRNAVQKKSAGSFLLGGFVNIDYAGFQSGATNSFVPNFFPKEVKDTFDIDAYVSRSFGVSFGYTYTFVFFKRFFINISLVPGLGSTNLTVYKQDIGEVNIRKGTARFIGRTALGYENKHFVIGLTSYSTTGTIDFQNFKIKPSTSNVKFFIAKRFNLKKSKK